MKNSEEDGVLSVGALAHVLIFDLGEALGRANIDYTMTLL